MTACSESEQCWRWQRRRVCGDVCGGGARLVYVVADGPYRVAERDAGVVAGCGCRCPAFGAPDVCAVGGGHSLSPAAVVVGVVGAPFVPFGVAVEPVCGVVVAVRVGVGACVEQGVYDVFVAGDAVALLFVPGVAAVAVEHGLWGSWVAVSGLAPVGYVGFDRFGPLAGLVGGLLVGDGESFEAVYARLLCLEQLRGAVAQPAGVSRDGSMTGA